MYFCGQIQLTAMFQDKYVFAQLTAFLNRIQFNNYVRKYDSNRYVKHFTCWNRLLVMMFDQLSNRESLRDLIVAFEAHRAKQYHLELGREPIAKTTLASANQNRDYRIFEDFAFYMMMEACEKRTTNILNIPEKNMLLTQLQSRCVWQHSHGQDSEEERWY
ncbi:protein of unknown function [Segatella bryantii]|nr:protein of unknown function [Segatella bryantii]